MKRPGLCIIPPQRRTPGSELRPNPFTSFSKGSRTFSLRISTCSAPISSAAKSEPEEDFKAECEDEGSQCEDEGRAGRL